MPKSMLADIAEAAAPATIANVGPGFDVFGFALAGPCDTVRLKRTERTGVRITEILGDAGVLSRNTKMNVASAVVAKMLRAAKARFGAEIVLIKGLPLGSGLGSSSASAVAAAVAANRLLGERFDENELLEFARHGEKVACGVDHADNVAPALFGGFTIVRGQSPVEIIRLEVPSRWRAVVVHPHFELPTRASRAVLPATVPLAALMANVSNAASLVAAIYKKDLRLFGRAVMGDAVVTPSRSRLIPGFDEVVRGAVAAGAAGASISGAGPSIFALTDSDAHAKVVARKIAAAWLQKGVDSDVIVSRIGAAGALDRR